MYTLEDVSRIKKHIKSNMDEALCEYSAANDCADMFLSPVVSYHYAKDPIFDTLYRMGMCEHPGKVYRPGNTIITYFLPYSPQIIESNRGGNMPSAQWSDAYRISTGLIMRLNRAIREELEANGRLVSYLNTPIDWDEKKAHEEWSHKIVAFLSGMGKFSTAHTLVTEKGCAGRFSGMITDGLLFDSKPEGLPTDEAQKFVETIINDSYGVSSEEAVSACPCGAISQNGIDKFKCQEFCKSINKYVPSPDVCGKCFFY